MFSIHHAKLEDWAKQYDGPKFHAVLCDPPYDLGFMGKEWDKSADFRAWGEAIYPLLYPGALVLMFGGTRTWHRLACGMEDAGFEMWDTLMWLYGQGFPKAQDISKLIDSKNGNEREVVGAHPNPARNKTHETVFSDDNYEWSANALLTAPGSDISAPWSGHKTCALKPAWEPILCFKKPLDGTYAECALQYGSGALNVDGGRIGTETRTYKGAGSSPQKLDNHGKGDTGIGMLDGSGREQEFTATGRYPANLILDEVSAGMLDEQSGELHGAGFAREALRQCKPSGNLFLNPGDGNRFGDSGGASRFFYTVASNSTCILCNMPYDKHVCKNTSAKTAENHSLTTPEITESIVPESVETSLAKRIAHNARCAESLCDSCAIGIARALVETKLSGSSSAESQAFLDSIGNSRSSILTRNLACFAELWGSIDIIPTTASLSILFGSVRHAIESCTKSERSAEITASGPIRFRYVAKASTKERNAGLDDQRNTHPTVKPVDLNRYLATLLLPPDSVKPRRLLVPFAGSGSEIIGASLAGWDEIVGIEKTAEYIPIAEARIKHWSQPAQLALT